MQYFLFWFQKIVSWLSKEILEAGNEEVIRTYSNNLKRGGKERKKRSN